MVLYWMWMFVSYKDNVGVAIQLHAQHVSQCMIFTLDLECPRTWDLWVSGILDSSQCGFTGQ